MDLSALTADTLSQLSDADLRAAASDLLHRKDEVRREMQILYYRPASDAARKVHFSKASVIGVGGGNRSSKTETCLVESVALATGVFPVELREVFQEKFRGPINVRICLESLTTVLHPVFLPKLQWWTWTGVDAPGGARGHWGWIPRMCLKNGEWSKSWSEKLRTLSVLCRNPAKPEEILGESTFQLLSYDQDATDFASGTFHIVQLDEPPPYPIWRENQARVMDVGGRIFLSMTWPDDASIAVDWIYDEVYERGLPGPMKDPDIDWIELDTTLNVYIDQEAIAKKAASWDETTRKVRLEGQPLRFSNRIHPLFSDTEQTWCFTCNKPTVPQKGICGCGRLSSDLELMVHVEEFEIGHNWPVVFLLDPHPRKPHMMLWVAIDPKDDYWVVHEAEVDGDAPDVAALVEGIEESMEIDVRLRLMDPNMGRSPGMKREITWEDEFASAGLRCDLADDSDVGRKRVNLYLKPDERTRRPRLVIHTRCQATIMQMKRYVWDDYRRTKEKGLKQIPKPKYDDYPTLLKYLLNWMPDFKTLYEGPRIIGRRRERKAAYG